MTKTTRSPVDLVFRTSWAATPIRTYSNRSRSMGLGADVCAPGVVPFLEELQAALLADAAALATWQRLDGYMAVARAFAKDVDEATSNRVRELQIQILRALAPTLSAKAQSYFARALVHRAWLFQHPDGVTFSLAFDARVDEEPIAQSPRLGADPKNRAMEALYQRGQLPPAAGAEPKAPPRRGRAGSRPSP